MPLHHQLDPVRGRRIQTPKWEVSVKAVVKQRKSCGNDQMIIGRKGRTTDSFSKFFLRKYNLKVVKHIVRNIIW